MADKHLSTQFDSELNGVSSRVMELGGLVESQIRLAIYALAQFNAESGQPGDRNRDRVNRWKSTSTASCRPSSRGASPRRATCAC
jgi:phosphate uptake regulator